MSLDHILLGMLSEPTSGYDLRKQFAEGPAMFWTAEYSQIHPTLKRMERAGWVRGARRRSRRGPPAIVYRRTARGIAELDRWLRSGPALPPERAAYIGQLIFMGQIDDLAATRRFLEEVERSFARTLDVLEAAEAELLAPGAADPGATDAQAFHELLSLRLGTAVYRARVRASREALRLVAERERRRERKRGRKGKGAPHA